MKNNIPALTAPREPTTEEIRDYAYHLYAQEGCVDGHDLDHWLEAEACLRASVPREHSRTRLHRQRLPGAAAGNRIAV
ncbi:MAG TPA: DUF2934 domain-containing protein [Opitutaceae bacterium]|nr:DUF2934 domain-containing protein [Opitutaceae bacterium]